MSEANTTTGQEDSDYDPFESFNRAQGMGTVADPYPIFAGMRAQGPIVEIDLALAAAGPQAELMSSYTAMFSAVSFRAVSEVLRDGRRFSSKGICNEI